jgi:type IV secretory pathway TraG/TraD family ATPase VirD4
MEHIYLIGQSGSGKSTLIKEQLLNDIDNGDGVIYLDPHGTDIDDLLPYLPAKRRNDVVLFDPSDHDHPIAWNPLEIDGPIALITSAFERGLKDASGYSSLSTPTMSLYIRASIYALTEAGEPLTGLPFILMSVRYRNQILEKVHDPLIKRFWRDFERLTTKEKRAEITSTYNKAFALILDHRIRNILGQRKSAFAISEILSGKILLARFPQGQLGFEQIRVLGILLLSQIHLAAMANAATVPTRIYIDECHTFDGAILAEMLTGIRKYNVGITLAHQNLDQLSTELRAAILGNVSRKYVFRVSMKDARDLNEHLGPDNVRTELYKLPPYHARCFHGTKITETKIQPSEHPTFPTHPKKIRSNMRRNYARPARSVRREIDHFINAA